MKKTNTTVLWLLRISLASVFLYAAIAATLQPYNWIGYIPTPLHTLAPVAALLLLFSLFQLILTLWLLSTWQTPFVALLSALTIGAIILSNVGQLDILFRDFAIFFAALALFVGSQEKKK